MESEIQRNPEIIKPAGFFTEAVNSAKEIPGSLKGFEQIRQALLAERGI
jgi:hypothetical protein